MKYPIFLVFLFVLVACEPSKKSLTAQEIVNEAIAVAGGSKFDSAAYSFQFRDKQYFASRNKGLFTLARTFKDTTGIVKDVITNSGFTRYVNNKPVVIADSTKAQLHAAVNSVHYFAVLPYGLNDAAVNKELLGTVSIKNTPYYKIKVTFNEAGGGEDYEDVFIYWIHTNTFKTAYLAYSYEEDDGIGFRFREAFNERYVGEMRFVDYNNYKTEKTDILVEDLDDLFENNSLTLVSKINLEAIKMAASFSVAD
ncbi:DUF6503 family protein [Bizionia sediminis]|uniref:DUF6503 family protein n=1 Tax=Bizionia sediminis TaxID=1737064 RepID=A0ABW5KX23_9FLAO